MKIRIRGVVHDPATFDQLTIRQTIQLNGQLREMGVDMTLDQIREAAERQGAGQKMSDFEAMVMTGVMMWATRSVAGEHISLGEACDVRLDEFEWVNDDGTPIPPEELAGNGPEGKATGLSPQGSAGAGGNRAERRAAAKRTTSRTS